MLKILLAVVWGLVIANVLIALPQPMVWPLHAVGSFLVVAHIAEYFIFNRVIKAKGDGTLKSFLMTFFFGTVYIKNL